MGERWRSELNEGEGRGLTLHRHRDSSVSFPPQMCYSCRVNHIGFNNGRKRDENN